MVELQLLNQEDAPVVFQLAHCNNDMKVAVATLNAPKALNALNLDMIRLLAPQLSEWSADDSIAMVVLKGAGEKAFCAGGDVVSLYKAMAADDDNNYLETFFSEEYRLDYQIHNYDKPILLWGNGIIMGGGLGLMAGASHRVVTETSRIAMPEITIGLYPDVGGSYFLNKMPEGVGLFLGLTGASVNANDAKFVGLADHFINADHFDILLHNLSEVNWGKTNVLNHDKLTQLLLSIEEGAHSLPNSAIKPLAKDIKKLVEHADLAVQVDHILSMDSSDNKWLSKAQAGLKHGSPLSAVLVSEQLKRLAGQSLKACFSQELNMSVHCGEVGEFQEGVRALLIDKDGKPNWHFKSIAEVDSKVVDGFFVPKWDDENHPLASM
ncbi:enoyl-CoA hydratase/isomerase family protein [Pseudoalteromonas luteoviolacea]|uniref:3-hydroxyisobutyryl-CoA hydrolase n=1 Tax=Pseudoalteromonas luteoviolacea H33 TaxID=1365251 RepID=A0A167E066_9GAMM|nr:enoyl-CoA hydratase/isomerase family protein [Pseudoalteromonas luteoviolacea]KZN49826.1 enoyl-CoA hydratase [Pseudoalteromonas luteoviolacea H33]KZN77850.1 enoyl-CoA hydratase [Pseudoalteromonas luteoviolacea H33-S]MBQ4879445.1 enoyl-CoA hydratase/isomerase family protein [Pseudoalteromonas luteoviolacea]MBQ4908505.1 enoyl-CoA hydratase/isomerase family protein [Pseudoalteromonas luteoviolacea]